MKKNLALILSLLTCCIGYALPVGDPAAASLFHQGVYIKKSCDDCSSWSFRTGFYGNYVFNRYLEIDDSQGRKGEIPTTKINTNSGYLVLNFCDRVDLFSSIGASSLTLRYHRGIDSLVPTSTPEQSAVFETAFSWSIGGRATLWKCRGFYLGLEGEYFCTSPEVKRLDLINRFFYTDNTRVPYREWQIGLGTSYVLMMGCPTAQLVPYVAIKASRASLSNFSSLAENPGGSLSFVYVLPKLISQKSFGYVIGTTLALYDMIAITAEGRFGDEQALYINGQFRF